MRLLLPLLLAACESGTITIGDADSAVPDATDAPVDTDAPDTVPDDTEPPASTGDDTDAPPAALGDLAEGGPSEVDVTDGRYSASTCTLEYRKFTPRQPASSDVVVILSHGFMRDRDQMRGWAKHVASWGVTVYTPNLCHATFVDADHAKNGEELAAFANDALRGQRVLYAGHSAGALASLLAITHDADALGVLTLDLVDTDDLGLQAAATVRQPVRALVGDPSWACNSDGNGVPVVQRAPDHLGFRITDAVHCDFESPTDNGCTTVCSWQFPGPQFTDRQQARVIQAMIAGFALGVGGVDPRALDYWSPGRAAWDDRVRDNP